MPDVLKSTGIVRRIDDLGRIVIPKEFRHKMKINEGDPLELFTVNNDFIAFKKFDIMSEADYEKAAELVKCLYSKHFAILNSDYEIKSSRGLNKADIENFENTDTLKVQINEDFEICIAYNNDDIQSSDELNNLKLAVKILQTSFKEFSF